YKFKTFCELYKSFTSTEVGSATNDSLEKMVNDTYKIYSPAQERNFGVLAIRIRLIH
ncbi:ASCH domain-containing protein, partial [Oenococcus oeni]